MGFCLRPVGREGGACATEGAEPAWAGREMGTAAQCPVCPWAREPCWGLSLSTATGVAYSCDAVTHTSPARLGAGTCTVGGSACVQSGQKPLCLFCHLPVSLRVRGARRGQGAVPQGVGSAG